MISRRRIASAIHRPSQARSVVPLVSQVGVCRSDQPPGQAILTKQRCPMERGLSKLPAQFWSGAGLEQPEPRILGSKACRSDQRGLAFALAAKVNIRSRVK